MQKNIILSCFFAFVLFVPTLCVGDDAAKPGKTKSLGNGQYEFIAEVVDSDVLEF